ncbi:MAG: DUF2721 domain-containing protein [Chitinophagaceae bacterium]|nr:DUF2721 domain-containing protein [Chitinophagaceae bacterium]
MEITLTTPAILFPTVSLLLIAYTTRFLAIANLIRGLKIKYQTEKTPNLISQINNLRVRLTLIRNMQAFGISALFFATFSIALIFFDEKMYGSYVFGFALILLLISLGVSFREILMSGGALKFELKEMEEELRQEEENN